jgi:hypothetical protein
MATDRDRGFRSVVRQLTGAELGTFTLPPPLVARVQLLTGNFPTLRPRVVFPAAVPWANLHFVKIHAGAATVGRVPSLDSVSMVVTSASLRGGLEFEIPELSEALGLAGLWDRNAPPPALIRVESLVGDAQVEAAGRDVRPELP